MADDLERLEISNDDCIVQRDGAVVVITMNRPEKRNALSPAMLVGLTPTRTSTTPTTYGSRC
jgi:1,4-dihydroxy-2-naphthoyl-CoA synthase